MKKKLNTIVTIFSGVNDGTYTLSVSNHIRSCKVNLPQWRQHTANELLTFDDLKQTKLSIDKISQFSLRPPEFRSTIDMVGNYFRWFHIEMKKVR